MVCPPLTEFYGGPLVLPDGAAAPVIANFVTTVDGITSFDRSSPDGAAAVNGGSSSDRMLMAILRAAADVILVGAGTLRVSHGHRWTAEALMPGCTRELAEARAQFTGAGHPPALAVVSAGGDVDLAHPAFAAAGRAMVLTTDRGAARLKREAGPALVMSIGSDDQLDAAHLIAAVRERLAPRLILTEGGPVLFGSLLSRGVVDELFLTVAPIIAGRAAADPRPGLVDGFAADPGSAPGATLRSLRRSTDGMLCFRYRIGGVS